MCSGFSAEHETWKLKQKLLRCIDVLLRHKILRLPEDVSCPKMLFVKRAKGAYNVRFHRGPHFEADRRPPR